MDTVKKMIVVVTVLYVTLVAALGYVAFHFISKIW